MMFHYCNWCLWENVEGYIAYRGLSAQISKEEIIKQTCSLSGKRAYENKTGIFSLSIEEKKKYSSIGGKKAGKYMSQSMWINDGEKNKRVLKTEVLSEGWNKGKVKKAKIKKYGRSWEEYMDSFCEETQKRLEYMINVDLTKWGIKTKIANDWGISRTQVNRFLDKHHLQLSEPLPKLSYLTFAHQSSIIKRSTIKSMTLTSKFKKDISALRGAANGDFLLDVKNPKLYKKVRRYYQNEGVIFSDDPLDNYDILIECIAQDLETSEVV
jgi:hypothetical protein